MLKPGLNIIVGVHPLGFKGLIACMLDVGFADDMGGMPDIEGMFIVDDDSDAILDMESTEVIEFTDSGVLLADMETGQGWAIDIVGVEDSGFAVATTLLLAIESIVGSFIDILGINSSGLSDLRIIVPTEEPLIGLFVYISGTGLAIDMFGSFVDIPCIAAVDNIVVLPVPTPEIPGISVSSPRPTPACSMDSGRHSTFP